jgi:preprotein translocase subunit YajC
MYSWFVLLVLIFVMAFGVWMFLISKGVHKKVANKTNKFLSKLNEEDEE